MGFSLMGMMGLATAGGTAATTSGLAAGAAVGIDTLAGAGVSAGLGAALARKPTLPPSPVIPQAQQNEQIQNQALEAQKRASIAGGIESTVGTPGGQAGQMLDPANLGQRTLLGQ
jgi:hypothetical protein